MYYCIHNDFWSPLIGCENPIITQTKLIVTNLTLNFFGIHFISLVMYMVINIVWAGLLYTLLNQT